VPDPVADVLEVVPLKVEIVDPLACALPRLPSMFVKSVLILDKISIKSVAVGAVLLVIVVPVCDAMDEMLLTSPAHCVAVTVPPALTVDNALWP